MRIIDAHAHFDHYERPADVAAVLERARQHDVHEVIAIGATRGLGAAEQIPALLDANPSLHGTCGLHPHDAKIFDATAGEQLATLLGAHPRIVAIGETGLDFHYDFSPRDAQELAFRFQLKLARDRGCPVVLHIREAHEEAREILDELPPPRAVVHCFTGTVEDAHAYLERGYWLSFSGILTFGKSEVIREVARLAPADRIMVETDSPYLTPAPHRKIRQNEPRFVVNTLARLAEIRGLDLEEAAALTAANTRAFFGLKSED
jgi:TatD DNase family protein